MNLSGGGAWRADSDEFTRCSTARLRICHAGCLALAGKRQPVVTYRAYFHDADGASDEYEVDGLGVSEVLTWAETKRRSRTFVLYVCVPQDGLRLLRLSGSDPNSH